MDQGHQEECEALVQQVFAGNHLIKRANEILHRSREVIEQTKALQGRVNEIRERRNRQARGW